MKVLFASAFVAGAVALVACSSSTTAPPADPDAPVRTCDSSLCAAGNTCQELDGDLKCRKSCSSNNDPSTNCPVNYTCVGANEPTELPATGCTKVADKTQSDNTCGAFSTTSGTRLSAYTCAGGAVPVHGCVGVGDGTNFCCNDEASETLAAPLCVKSLSPVATPNAANQWGAACLPAGGVFANPQCDSAQGFNCYAPAGPSDGSAYCTRYDCTSDRECGPGMACERTNIYPDAVHADVGHDISTAAGFHMTQTVCVKRQYGSFCRTDVDCNAINGATAHCEFDQNNRGFCTPECTKDANCNYDAFCLDGGQGYKTCFPRAQVIIGTGDLCSPCQSDADCGDDGICIQGEYTQEHFCAKHNPTPCTDTTMCGAPVAPGAQTSCLHAVAPSSTSEGYDPGPLTDYCVGFYNFAGSGAFGCYTPKRD